MDVKKWPLDEIMQLPDWCFGRRWWIGDYLGHTTGKAENRIGHEQLPDRFVVWGVLTSARSANCLEALRLTLRLAQNLTAYTANVKAFDRLLKGISVPDIQYEFYVPSNGVMWLPSERTIHVSKGRRLAYTSNGDQVIQYEMTVGVLISSVPREVPDWVVLGLGGRL